MCLSAGDMHSRYLWGDVGPVFMKIMLHDMNGADHRNIGECDINGSASDRNSYAYDENSDTNDMNGITSDKRGGCEWERCAFEGMVLHKLWVHTIGMTVHISEMVRRVT